MTVFATKGREEGHPAASAGAFRWSRDGDEVVAEWPGVLSLRVDADGNVKNVCPAAAAEREAIDKIRHGAAAAFVRALGGRFSLHASAVSRRADALVCVGASGTGKSTLAGALSATHGFELLADDVVALDSAEGRWHASPSERAVWLHAEVGGCLAKTPHLRPAAAGPRAISWVVLLRFDDRLERPTLRRLRGTSIASTALQALLRFDPSPSLMKREIELAEGLAGQAAFFELARPRSLPVEAAAGVLVSVTEVEPR